MVNKRYGTECCQLIRVQIYSGRAFTELRQDCHQNVVWVILCRRLSIQKDWYLRHALNLSGQYQSCSVTCKNCLIRHRTFCKTITSSVSWGTTSNPITADVTQPISFRLQTCQHCTKTDVIILQTSDMVSNLKIGRDRQWWSNNKMQIIIFQTSDVVSYSDIFRDKQTLSNTNKIWPESRNTRVSHATSWLVQNGLYTWDVTLHLKNLMKKCYIRYKCGAWIWINHKNIALNFKVIRGSKLSCRIGVSQKD